MRNSILVIALLGVVQAACATERAPSSTPAPPPSEPVYTVTRTGQRVELRSSDASSPTAQFELQPTGLSIALQTPAGDVGMVIEQPARDDGSPGVPSDQPIGTVRDSDGTELALAITGAGWSASYGAQTFRLTVAADRQALATSLAAGPLGSSLHALLPLHAKVRAVMAETRSAFVIAALTDAALGADPSAWPTELDPLDRDPPGMIDSDHPGLSMTCATTIRCPGEAPICVTEDHEHTFGFCSRTCSDDRDCGDGAICGLAVGDIPGVSGALKLCYTPCPGACPQQLACVGEFGTGVASVCAPDQP